MKIAINNIKPHASAVLLTILLCLTGIDIETIKAAELQIYKSIDKDGRQYFGDAYTKRENAEVYQNSKLRVIKIISSKLTKKKNKGTSRRKLQNPKRQRIPRCAALNSKIASLERQLRTKQLAEQFDSANKKMTEFKWEKIKYC